MAATSHLFSIADDVSVWIADGGSIHIKTNKPHGDPVELTEEDAVELAAILTRLVQELRA